MKKAENPSASFLELTEGGGEVGRLLRTQDWTSSPVGPFESWPQSLKTALSICLGSKFPMFVWWGKDLTAFYNDAYIPFCQRKHPHFLGRPAREQWAEIWDVIEPLTKQVLETGVATWAESMQLFMRRKGFLEETYFTFSYSPIRDETGAVAGIINPCQETTHRVLSERRLTTLHDLGSEKITDYAEVGSRIAAVLSKNTLDIPFALVYLTTHGATEATLVGASGIPRGTHASPLTIDLTSSLHKLWPLVSAFRSRTPQIFSGIRSPLGSALPTTPFEEGPDSAYFLPLCTPGKELPIGFLILGMSPRLEFDSKYKDFFQLVAQYTANHLMNARALEEEKERTEGLAEIDRAKTTFFNNVSHEFRTPLTLILGPLDTLLSKGTFSGAVRQEMEMIYRNALRLQKLVNTLLDFSRIEQGRMQATYEPIDLSKFTAELAASFQSLMQGAGLNFVIDCAALPDEVYVDPELWEKIVLNLLSNAFKYTLQGEVRVSLQAIDGNIELRVEDTGVGIPETDLKTVFERFHRVEGMRGRSFEGTGIGLALVKELVELHGGQITADSRIGQGTTFRVIIRKGAEHLPAERVIHKTQTHTPANLKEWLAPLEDTWIPPITETQDDTVPRARILLADDNADMRDYVSRILKPHWEVQSVADGLVALESAKAHLPDLIISDVMMPNMGGFELLRHLKDNVLTKDIPVIILSARAGEEAKVEGLEKGADDYLVKPFAAKELMARTRTLLSKHRETVESLRRKTLELSRLNSELEQFAWISSHDLKEPLRMVKINVQLLEEMFHHHLDSGAEQWIKFASDGVTRMYEMIDSILRYTGIGKDKEPSETVDLEHVLRAACDNLSPTISATHAIVENTRLPSIQGHTSELIQLIQNLIGNALKYRRNGVTPHIQLLAVREKQNYLFAVRDNGIGISKEYHDKIFEIFKRLHDRETYAGSGIGLAICKKVVEHHGGRIWLESNINEGTTFYFTLPA